MWDPIVSVSDHCSCFTFIEISAQFHYKLTKKNLIYIGQQRPVEDRKSDHSTM